MNKTTTNRGFSKVTFEDENGVPCSIQESSAIDFELSGEPGSSFIWLGIEDCDAKIMAVDAKKLGISTEQEYGWIPYDIPDEVLLPTRMHLDRESVKCLIRTLSNWLETGEL